MTVVLSPWHNCPIGFYSLLLGLAIARRGKYRVQFLVNDISYPAPDSPVFDAEVIAIERVLANIPPSFQVDRLQSISVKAGSAKSDFVGEVVEEAVSFDMHSRLMVRVLHYDSVPAFRAAASKQMREVGERLAIYFERQGSGAVLVPGGLANGFWVFSRLAQSAGLRVASYDAGPGLLHLAKDGVAAQQPENIITYQYLLAAPVEEQTFAINRARLILAKREKNGDGAVAVRFDPTRATSYDILLCMNVEGDTAAQRPSVLFKDQCDWLETTVTELSWARPGIRIAVRQHPLERGLNAYQSEFAIARLRQLGVNGISVDIFEAKDDVSTYELARRCKVVVVETSTVGVEVAMLAVPVVTVRQAYYSDTDFVYVPGSLQEYVRLLLDKVDHGSRLSLTQQRHAHLMYYVLEDCNRVWFDLTPIPEDFLRWLRGDRLRICTDATFNMMLTTFEGGAPFSMMRHLHNWGAAHENISNIGRGP